MIDRSEIVPLVGEDVQTIEKALEDARVDGMTRRALVGRAAVAAAATGALGFPAGALAASGGDTVQSVVNTAVTAEALVVVYLTGVITKVKGANVDKFRPVLKNALSAEYDHYKALKGLGAKPLTLKFWAPDAAFAPENVFSVIEQAETIFVNAYLIGMTVFSKAGKPDLVRYAGEILGTEAQHRTLARFAQGMLPNNNAFETYALTTTKQLVKGLEGLGIGFGKQGAKPGKFYTFAPPPASALGNVKNDSPM